MASGNRLKLALGGPTPGPETLTISGTPDTEATEGVPYAWTPTIAGGVPPYTVTNIGTALPTGWAVNSSTGELTAASPLPSAEPTDVELNVVSSDLQSATLNPFSVDVQPAGVIYVENDAQLAVALTTLATMGGRIVVATVNTISASLSLTQKPAAPIEFYGEDPDNKSPFATVISFGNAAGPFTFRFLDQSTADTTSTAIFTALQSSLAAAAVDIVIQDCDFLNPPYDPNGNWTSSTPTSKALLAGKFNGLRIERNNFRAFYKIIKPNQFFGALAFNDNNADLIHEDFISGGLTGAVVTSVQVTGNFATRFTGRSTDLGGNGPHTDFIQFWLPESDGPIFLHLQGNIYVKGDARGSAHWMLTEEFSSDFGPCLISDNILMTSVDNDFAPGCGYHSGGLMTRFWLLRYSPGTSSGTCLSRVNTGPNSPPAAIADSYVESWEGLNATTSINLTLAPASAADRATIQAACFDGPFDVWPTDRAAAYVACRPKAGGPLAAYRSVYDYDTSTQLVAPRTYIGLGNVTYQPISDTYETPILRIVGGDAAVGYAITDVLPGTSYILYDDAAGGGATAESSADTVTTKGYIKVLVATSPTYSTSQEIGLTLDGYVYNRFLTTEDQIPYPEADSNNIAYSLFSGIPSASSQTRLLLFVEARLNGIDPNNKIPPNGSKILTSNGNFNLGVQEGKIVFAFRTSGSIQTNTNFPPDNNWHKYIIAIDFTKTTSDEVLRIWIDGNLQTHGGVNTTGALTFNPSTHLANSGIAANPITGVDQTDITYRAVLEDWHTAAVAFPDLNDRAVLGSFNRDALGTDGSGVLGHAASYYGYGAAGDPGGGDANTYNATGGLTNRSAANSMTLTVQSGDYVPG